MKNSITIILVFLLGIFIGFVFGNSNILDQEKTEEKQVMLHDHMQMEVMGENIPSVDLVIHEDPNSGYNAQIILENLEFAPLSASKQYVEGEGHAHIYIDGFKINRVYGEWYHLGELEKGSHEVVMTLSSNNHMELTKDGEVISDTEILIVK